MCPTHPQPLPDAQADHQTFGRGFPELALAARELVEAGLGREQIIEALTTAPAVPAWLVSAAESEIDYLLATNAGGRSQRGMSTDMRRPA